MTSLRASALLPSAVLLLGLSALPATAQTVGNDVDVNLEALGLGSTPSTSQPKLILRYPGSETATRKVPSLRYPTVPEPAARPSRPVHTDAAKPPAPKPVAQKAPAPEPAQAPTPEVAAKAPAPVAPVAPEPASVPADRSVSQAGAVAAPVRQATPAPPAIIAAKPEAAAAPPAQQLAALTPADTVSALPDPDPAILRVMFDEETAAIVGEARAQLDAIGESLRYDPRRIELKAYGGEPGDKASDARRLSLKRGLAVRAYLISLGIDSRRIDVRALGGIIDTGAEDRVDVAYSGT